MLDLYDDEKHHYLADLFNRDPKTLAGIFGSISTWILGSPDRALLLGNEADLSARGRGHPFDHGYTLMTGVHEFDRRIGPEKLRQRAEECEGLGRENSLPFVWGLWAPYLYSLALTREGKSAEAIAPLRAVIKGWEATGGKLRSPTYKAYLAEALAMNSDIDNALVVLDEVIAQIERPGWEERFFYAEALRLRGWMLSLKHDYTSAEGNFLASLDWARRQQAKMWELRTSTSLARLWQSQGKRQDAYELLAPIYAWFTEGFDTRELLDAKALLAELG